MSNKTKLLDIAYSYDENHQEYVIFKKINGGDFELKTCKTQTEADEWIKANFVCLRTDVDYNLMLPYENE